MRFVVASAMSVLFLAAQSPCQSGAVIPEGGAGHAANASCVILKRMGRADEVTSHLYSFGIWGKQFQYIEGKLPEEFPFHGRLTDHDVRSLQGRGTEVFVLEPHYTSEELMEARAHCRGETGSTPNKAEAKAAPSPALTGVANPSATTTTSDPSASAGEQATAPPLLRSAVLQATLIITSNPTGGEISVDGNFVGNTPSELVVVAGVHRITITGDGYKPWERQITVSSGKVTVAAKLQQ